MALKVKVNAGHIASQFKGVAREVESDIKKGVAALAAQTHAWVAQQAAAELKTEGSIFRENLRYEEIGPTLHVITILEPALWIEEGIKAGTDMKEWFFKNAEKTKVSKEGYRYRAIKFQHNKAPSTQPGYEQNLAAQIKSEFAKVSRQRVKEGKEPIKWGKIELDPTTKSPRIGKLHEFDFKGGRASSKWSNDPLQKLMVFQNFIKDRAGNQVVDHNGKPKIKRDIVTFRTASDNPKSHNGGGSPSEKFIHPGYTGKKFLDKAYDEAIRTWENQILPDILKKWK